MTTLDDAVAQMMEFGLEVEIPVADGNIKKCVFQQENRSRFLQGLDQLIQNLKKRG